MVDNGALACAFEQRYPGSIFIFGTESSRRRRLLEESGRLTTPWCAGPPPGQRHGMGKSRETAHLVASYSAAVRQALKDKRFVSAYEAVSRSAS